MIDQWEMSQNRYNIMLFAQMCELDPPNAPNHNPKTFCLLTYHILYDFFEPVIMNIYAKRVAQQTQNLNRGNPHILAGECNIVSSSSTYNLIIKRLFVLSNTDIGTQSVQ